MDHTILIRTRNRPDWIIKTLDNYKKYSFEGTIYLLDDSEESQFEKNQQSVSEFCKKLKIRHEPGLGRKLPNRFDRVRVCTMDALKKINTKYNT